MKLELLFNLTIVFLINLVLVKGLFDKKREEHKRIFLAYLILISSYTLFFVIVFLWFYEIITYNFTDFLAIYSFLIFVQTFILYYILYNHKQNKKIFSLLLFYILILLVPFSSILTPLFLVLFSYLLTLLIFCVFLKISDFKKISYVGIFYSSVSLLITGFLFMFNEKFLVLSIALNFLFLVFLFVFVREIKNLESIKKFPKERKSYLIDLLRYFVFIFVLSTFIFVGTISIHELGHLGSAKILGCSSEKIIFEGKLPRTEFLCYGESSKKIAILGGVFLPLITALLFFLGGGIFIKEIALLITGINLIISYKDYLDLGLSQNIGIYLSLIGGIIIIFAIGMLAKSRTNERIEKYINN